MDPLGLTAVPWRFADSEHAKLWTWTTDHFVATITNGVNYFAWELHDKISLHQDAPRFLTEGRSADFQTSENEIREAVGKSYPTSLNYGHYAGFLATTFLLATGVRADLSAFNGKSCLITVRQRNGVDQNIVGYVQIVHYELQLTNPDGSMLRIQPAHIVRVVREAGGGDTVNGNTHTGMGRIYRGQRTAGCNGVPGFLPDTIDHFGPVCALHESAAPRLTARALPL